MLSARRLLRRRLLLVLLLQQLLVARLLLFLPPLEQLLPFLQFVLLPFLQGVGPHAHLLLAALFQLVHELLPGLLLLLLQPFEAFRELLALLGEPVGGDCAAYWMGGRPGERRYPAP